MKTQSVLITAPSEDVVTVAELKDYLRVDETAEDGRILIMIKAATKRLEELCDKKFVTQTWDTFLDDFPMTMNDVWWDGVKQGSISEMRSPKKSIELPFGPLQSVTYFKTFADDDTEETFPNTEYQVDKNGPYGRVSLRLGAVWPATVLRPTSGIVIRGVYGYGLAAAVPADIKMAVMQFAAKMYEHRGDELPKVPSEVALLLEPYRTVKIGC